MNKTKFKRVILYARQHRASLGVTETLERLVDFLKSKHIETVQDSDTEQSFSLNLSTLPRDKMGESSDLIVVVGGDGSLLSAAQLGIKVNVPVIGVNRGRLGFLTDISPNGMESQLTEVLEGHYEEERRFLLEMVIQDDDNTYHHCNALNDVVLSRGNVTHLIDFNVLVDQQFVSHYRSDGLILSTPTGSTAYALSAGGPILHPQLNALLMVPMFSHSLSSRPIVFDGQSQITIQISEKNEADLQVSCDGRDSFSIKPGQTIAIEKNAQRLRLLHPLDHNYYDTLRIKLGWGSKP